MSHGSRKIRKAWQRAALALTRRGVDGNVAAGPSILGACYEEGRRCCWSWTAQRSRRSSQSAMISQVESGDTLVFSRLLFNFASFELFLSSMILVTLLTSLRTITLLTSLRTIFYLKVVLNIT